MTDFAVDRSWATGPLFYEAPAPPGDVQPRRYQHAGAEYALARDHALIGDAPGLGKSCQAVLVSNALRARRTLVVCPASLRLNWEREVWKWSTQPNVKTYPTLAARDGVSPEADYQIISYDLLRNQAILRALLNLRWDHMILDEAHYLKDPHGNQRTRAICAPDALPSVVGRVTMLSGTILPNQPIECYNAARLLDWDAIDRMSLEDFREYYYAEGEGWVTRRVWDAKLERYVGVRQWSNHVRNVPRNLGELRTRLRSRVMVRRLKEHVLPELPPKQWHLFPLTPNKAMRDVLKGEAWQRAAHLFEMDPDAFDVQAPFDGPFSTAWRELGEAKAPKVADYVEELLSEGVRKVLVAAWHHTVLDQLRERLSPYGVAYMDGSTGARRKQAEVDRFRDPAGPAVFVGQMIPLGMGWPLEVAQDVVLAQPSPVPGQNDQLLDRVHRFGQTGDYVLGHVPVVPGTLDERLLARAIEKDISINLALDG